MDSIVAYMAALVSMLSVGIAWLAKRDTKRQADMAEQAVVLTQQAGQSSTIIHFTSRFFDLMKDGPRLDDRNWANQYWSLQAAEFYFFDYGLLSSFMYELWMVELVEAYRQAPEMWASHKQYLDRYAVNYPEMLEFFTGLADIAQRDFADLQGRNGAIAAFVARWHKEKASLPVQRTRAAVLAHRGPRSAR